MINRVQYNSYYANYNNKFGFAPKKNRNEVNFQGAVQELTHITSEKNMKLVNKILDCLQSAAVELGKPQKLSNGMTAMPMDFKPCIIEREYNPSTVEYANTFKAFQENKLLVIEEMMGNSNISLRKLFVSSEEQRVNGYSLKKGEVYLPNDREVIDNKDEYLNNALNVIAQNMSKKY